MTKGVFNMEEPHKPAKPQKKPTVWLGTTNIPPLFSFPISSESPELQIHITSFNNMLLFFEALAQNDTEKKCLYFGDRDVGMQIIGDLLKLKAFAEENEKSSSEHEQFYVRVKLAYYLLLRIIRAYLSNPIENFDEDYNFLIDILFYLGEIEKNEEMWWYYAAVLKFIADKSQIYDEELIEGNIECIENISSKKHREAIWSFIITQYYPKLQTYPQYELLNKLELLFPEFPWTLEGFCNECRHEYVENHLVKNKQYTNIQNSPLLGKCDSKETVFSITIKSNSSISSQEVAISISVNQKLLFQFAAHINAPSPPIFLIELPDGFKGIERDFSITFMKKLRTAGLCNSEGFLKDSFFAAKNLGALSFAFIKTLKEHKVEWHGSIAELFNNLKPEYEKLVAIRKQLSGLSPLDALWLFYKCLQSNHFELDSDMFDKIKNSVLACLEIAYKAKEISEANISDPNKHKAWFELAQQIVQNIIKNKCNLLIYVGTPIESGKNYSSHAIYVSLKYLPDEKIKIIITNGGLGVGEFHTIASHQVKNDRKEYNYAAFEPFELDQSHKEALTHYIYKLISLQYTSSLPNQSVDTDEQGNIIGTNAHTFLNELRNVYLRKSSEDKSTEYFQGRLSKKNEPIKIFIRNDLPQTFLSQFTGNCTIHNLKKSLQITFDMDLLTFGLFEDTLVLGLDSIISSFKDNKDLSEGNIQVKSTELTISKYPVKSVEQGNIETRENVGFDETSESEDIEPTIITMANTNTLPSNLPEILSSPSFPGIFNGTTNQLPVQQVPIQTIDTSNAEIPEPVTSITNSSSPSFPSRGVT